MSILQFLYYSHIIMQSPKIICPLDAVADWGRQKTLFNLTVWLTLKSAKVRVIEYPDAQYGLTFHGSIRFFRKLMKHKLVEVPMHSGQRFYHITCGKYYRKDHMICLTCPFYTDGDYWKALEDKKSLEVAKHKFYRYLHELEKEKK